jgi:TonB family protein
MRLFLLTLSIFLFSSIATFADEKADKKAFKAAYSAYQAAVNGSNNTLARTEAKAAYQLGKKLYGARSKNVAALAQNYGRLLQGKPAQNTLAEALTIYEELHGKGSYDLVDILTDLARSHAEFRNLSKANEYYTRALKIVEKKGESNSMYEGILTMEMGQVALSQAQSRNAIRYLKRAQKIFSQLDGANAELRLAQTKFRIGKYLLATNKKKAATEKLNSALATFTKYEPTSRLTLSTHAFLIQAYEKRGLRDEATKHCQAIGAAKPQDPNQNYLPIYRTAPVYPASAIRAHKKGYSIVSATISPEGFVIDPKVVDSGGSPLFKKAALDAVVKFRYAPRFENGKPVATKDVKYKFEFNIAN